MIKYTDDQDAGINACQDFIMNGKKEFRWFSLAGLAGTGKSTILKEIVRDFNCLPCAFIVKVVDVMRSKGISDARTIHSTIYKFNERDRKFIKRHDSEFLGYDAFAIDEGSTVTDDLWSDIQTFGLPVIVVGDHGQLEPVGKDPKLMAKPDFTLKQIHRQAEGDPIIKFSRVVREGRPFRRGTLGGVQVGNEEIFWDNVGQVDQLLCGFNMTRHNANAMYRERKGLAGELADGDQLMCLQNNDKLGVWNGMMLGAITVVRERVHRGFRVADVIASPGGEDRELTILLSQVGGGEKLEFFDIQRINKAGIVIADYGYCTTVHKFQGSEADSVAVLDEQCGLWDANRWRYTAVTRAAKELKYGKRGL